MRTPQKNETATSPGEDPIDGPLQVGPDAEGELPLRDGEVLDRRGVEVGLDQGMDLGLPLGHAHGCSPGWFLVAEPLGLVVIGIRQVLPAQRLPGGGTAPVRLRMLRVEADGLAVIGDGGLDSPRPGNGPRHEGSRTRRPPG